MRKRLLSILACLTLIFAGALWLGSAVLAHDDGRILCDLLSGALSSSTLRVSNGAVDGVLSGDATIRNVEVSDGDGPWLKLDRARLVWRRTALFARRLEVDRLELGRLEIVRRPVSASAGRPWSEGPLLPELPLPGGDQGVQPLRA
jgi:translocation and assembly module TamB